MHEVYPKNTVLFINKITGEEEVPENVQAIIVLNASDYPDVLAHVSVRARNLKVLLAVNFNQEECDELEKLQGQHVVMNVEGSNVKYTVQDEVASTADSTGDVKVL